MTPINRDSPEWAAIREYAATRYSELVLGLVKQQTEQETAEKRARIAELLDLMRAFDPQQITVEPEIDHGV